jgi:hypothetical protein
MDRLNAYYLNGYLRGSVHKAVANALRGDDHGAVTNPQGYNHEASTNVRRHEY